MIVSGWIRLGFCVPQRGGTSKANIKTSIPHTDAMPNNMITIFFFVLERAGLGLPLLAIPYAAAPPSNAIIM